MTVPYNAQWVREFVDHNTGPSELKHGRRTWRNGQFTLEFIAALGIPNSNTRWNVEQLKHELSQRSKWEIANVIHGLVARVEEIVIKMANDFSSAARIEDSRTRTRQALQDALE